MEYQHQTEKKAQVVLQYSKRRYDGGSEIELIKLIEARQAMKTARELDKQAKPKSISRGKRVLEAILIGPMEIAIGMVGMMTTTLAIATFAHQQKSNLVEQSKAVFKECAYTLWKGLWHTLIAPARAVKLATVG